MKHDVKFTIPWRELGKADVAFQVWGDQEKLGELRVSKGSLVWYPSNKQYGHKISWSRFNDMMADYPRFETRSQYDMGFDLHASRRYFHWTASAWPNVLALAMAHGWEPTGTGPPRRVKAADWDGSYCSNDGQLFYARDAKSFALALEAAIDPPQTSTLVQRERRRTDGWLMTPEGALALRRFIRFCRRGSFRIN